MLYISLALSAALLVVVNRMVSRSAYPAPRVILTGLGFTACPFGVMLVFPAVACQAALLTGLLLVLLVPRRGRRLYLPLSCLATVIAYGILLRPALEKRAELAELRDQHPYESLD
jgi:hypothetical protein